MSVLGWARRALLRIAERSLPGSIAGLSPTQQRRARLSVYVPLIAAAGGASGVLIQAALGRPRLGILVASAGVLASVLSSQLVRWTGSIRVGGHLIVASFFGFLLTSTVIAGGVGAPRAFALALLPMVATALLGWRGGAVWAGVCTLAVAVLMALRFAAPDLLPPLPADSMIGAHGGTMILFIVFGIIIIASYDRAHAAATRDLEREHQRVEEALAQAREAARLKDALIANVSHELRTPLNGILGSAELLVGSDLGDAEHEHAETIASAGDALLRVIDDLLDLSRLEAGGMRLEAIPFDLREILAAAVRPLGAVAESKPSLRLVLHVDPDVPEAVVGDPHRLRQVVTNLVGNALKFTTEGHVTLAVSMEEKQVRFAAQDTGIGIAAENLERIFRAFEQADSSTTRRHGGTGLGLDISRRLVALMGGALEVESELGVGSRFWFDLPLRPASSVERSRSKPHRVAIAIADEVEREAVAAALRFAGHHVVAPPEAEVVVHEDPSAQGGVCIVPPSGLADAGDRVRLARPFGAQALARAVRKAAGRTSSPPASSRVGGRVLLADDAEVNRKVIATQLAHLGYETVVVVDGEAAVRAVEEGPAFDVIMLDISMPAMDGYETARAIRALERSRGPRRAPMFALTGFQGEEHREQAMEAGFDRFLLKPLRLSDLDAVLTEARAHALPVIADDAWGQLVQLDDGSGAFLTEVVDGFLIRAEERMKLLAESRDVAATAHALKGSAAQLGARALQHACAELENEPDRLDDLLPVVTHELARASEELLHRIRPAPTSGGPASIVRVTLSDRLTREAVERALADAEPALSEGSAMLFDCRAMTGYEEDARGAFVAWHRTHQDRMGRVAIVTRRPLWRLVVSIMALGSGVAMRAFEDEDDALAWLEES